jgi:REP element-mobilizing transposase RayT
VPRKRRIDAPGMIHHVWARGVLKRPIFADDHDRSEFRDLLNATLVEAGARAFAWAFMSNHFHIVFRSGRVHLSIVMQFVLSEYARLFNLRHDRVGHLFQGRFGSRIVEGEAAIARAIRYVHLNPLVAGLVPDFATLASYRWCGHGALAQRRPPFAFEDAKVPLELLGTLEALEEWMMSSPQLRAPVDAFEALLEEVCRDLCVDRTEVLAGGRTRDDCSARRIVCERAVRELKLARSEVARRLHISPAAVTQTLAR